MELQPIILKKIEDLKGKATTVVDVTKLSDHFDTMIITSGTSSRHVQSLANHLVEDLKKDGLVKNMRLESDAESQWVLIDLGRTIVHVMQEETRQFYDLEKLWSITHIPSR
jgi:ribosome-associated protein